MMLNSEKVVQYLNNSKPGAHKFSVNVQDLYYCTPQGKSLKSVRRRIDVYSVEWAFLNNCVVRVRVKPHYID